MSKNPFAKYPLRYWYLNPDIDPKDPKVIQEYYLKQKEEGQKFIEEQQKKRQGDQEVKVDVDEKSLKQIEKELQKAFDSMSITIKL